MSLLNLSRQYLRHLLGIALLLAAPLVWPQAALTIVDTVSLDYGVIANNNGICKMSGTGVLSGTNGCTGTGILGQFRITGQPSYAITILVAGSSSNGVTFTPLIVGSSSKVIASNGRLTLKIRGNLTLNNVSVGSTGNTSLSYLVSANYQ